MGLEIADIMMEIEDQFDVKIDVEDECKLSRVNSLVDYVWIQVQKKPEGYQLKSRKDISDDWLSRVLGQPPVIWAPVDPKKKSDVEYRIRQIISGIGGVPMEKIKPESRLHEDLGLG